MNTINNTEPWGRFLVDAVREYAQAHKLNFELFSGDWIMRLEREDALGSPATKYLFGNDFGLNNTATRAICNDKSACYDVLTRERIPALEHRLLLKPGTLGAPQGGTYTLASQAFTEFSERAVCKPNSGSSGAEILPVHTQSELERALLELFSAHRAITISPLVDISHEYRICVLNNTVELAYEKVRQDDTFQHNLSHGAIAQDITNTGLLTQLRELASRCAHVLNADFVHVDIIDVSGELMVLEVNSGIMFEHYAAQSPENRARATEIYHKALDTLFT